MWIYEMGIYKINLKLKIKINTQMLQRIFYEIFAKYFIKIFYEQVKFYFTAHFIFANLWFSNMTLFRSMILFISSQTIPK